MQRGRALVIAGHLPEAPAAQPAADLVVAADGGLEVALSLGWHVDAVVGDQDSVSSETLDRARHLGIEVVGHPQRKDETDLELALEFARERAEAVHVLLSSSGRLDHALANLLVLASPRWAAIAVSATVDAAHVDVIRGTKRLAGAVGDTVSLVPVGGPARVRTWGLDYPLDDETLEPTSARGVSNIIVAVPAGVEVIDGALLVISPGNVDPHG